MFDWIFAFFHILLLLGLLAYAVLSLFQGNMFRAAIIFLGLSLYYLLVLYKPVKKEISRRK